MAAVNIAHYASIGAQCYRSVHIWSVTKAVWILLFTLVTYSLPFTGQSALDYVYA